ncbi:MAG TPA: hypothetical protein VFM90_12105, partial [Cyclobacteriaceae bacterium]|nr:hypothetical protein [Cyclobacteriaceae bacterium]
DITKEVSRETKKGKYDLLLVGSSRTVFSDDVVGGKVKTFLEETKGHAGVLVDKDFEIADRILVLLNGTEDLFLLSFAERFILNNNARVTLADPKQLVKKEARFTEIVGRLNAETQMVQVYEGESLPADSIAASNLVIVSYHAWQDSAGNSAQLLTQSPSLLILKAPAL